jgi:hypothetical protein
LTTYCQHVVHVGKTKCLLSVFGNMLFGMFRWHFLPNVGPKFSTCVRYVGACWDDMSFGGSRRRDMTTTFPTKHNSCPQG